MKKATLAACALIVASASLADARQNTRSMSCDQAIALVGHSRGIVLSTGANTYDRYVANGSFCIPGQITQRATVPTKDTSDCPIGFTCIDRLRVYGSDY